MAQNYSVYDFLFGLGKHWNEKQKTLGYNLIDVYNAIFEFVKQTYPDDTLLQELIALDYYLQHKIKPGTRFLPEISKTDKVLLFKTQSLNHHKYRYAIHSVSFSVQKFIQKGLVEPTNDWLIIEYYGTKKPTIVFAG